MNSDDLLHPSFPWDCESKGMTNFPNHQKKLTFFQKFFLFYHNLLIFKEIIFSVANPHNIMNDNLNLNKYAEVH